MSGKIFIILLCGIPASGKSSLAKAVQSLLEEHVKKGGTNPSASPEETFIKYFSSCYIIEYDNITEDKLFENENDESIKKSENAFNKATLIQAWRSSRIQAVKELELKFAEYSNTEERQDSSSKNHLIFVDDNFYLRSMRREIYLKCQEHSTWLHNLHFGVLYFSPLSLSTYIKRNQQRKHSENKKASSAVRDIPDYVIERMMKKIEEPSNKNQWENPFIIPSSLLKSNDCQSMLKNDEFVTSLHSYFLSLSPIQPKSERDLELLETERKKTRENAIHSLDLLLRRCVRTTCQIRPKLGKEVNRIRKQILEETKRMPFAELQERCHNVNLPAYTLAQFTKYLKDLDGADEDLLQNVNTMNLNS